MNGEGKEQNTKAKQLLDAIGELPEAMIAEAAEPEKLRNYRQKKSIRWIGVSGGLVAAAAVALVVWNMRDRLLIDGENGNVSKTSQEFAGLGEEESSDQSMEDGTDMELYLSSAWLAWDADEKAAENGDQSTVLSKKSASEDMESDRKDTYGADSDETEIQEKVLILFGQTIQIYPQDDSQDIEDGQEEQALRGRYFELNLGGEAAALTYRIIPECGVSCSAYTIDGSWRDSFQQETVCQAGENVRFLLDAGSQNVDMEEASDGNGTIDMEELRETDWSEQGIEPIAKIEIDQITDDIERDLYIGVRNDNYYIVIL